MRNLSTYFDRYGSEEVGKGTDKTTVHSYGHVYDFLMEPLKDRATAVLEIGFAGGFALQAYSDYFRHATIYGIDIENKLSPKVAENPRIKTHFGNAREPSAIAHFDTTYDVIIEDASHLPVDQIQHFIDYSPFVKPGGFYVIEDIGDDNLDHVRSALFPKAKAGGFEPMIFDLREMKCRGDDILMVFQKTRPRVDLPSIAEASHR